MKIGIPRALLYYNYYPFWESFFKELGHEIILSDHTSKVILDKGVNNCVDDACIPVKLFHGHVLDLIGKADKIFIPRYTSINKGEYICPKIIGLPEMAKNNIKADFDIITVEINRHNKIESAYKSCNKFAYELCGRSHIANKAVKTAYLAQKQYDEKLMLGENPLDILGRDRKNHRSSINNKDKRFKVGIVGHPYILYDTYISMNIIDKLIAQDYNIVLPENIPERFIDYECSMLPKRMFWSYAKKLYGSAFAMIKNEKVDGLIFISSFACGIDSFISDLVERINNRQYKIPFTNIIIDEHTGRGGISTRVEAFLDMMRWRNEYDSDISAHGKSLYFG